MIQQLKIKKELKLLIIGHARHGKDTCAEIMRDNFGITFISSSEAASKIFIFDTLKKKYNYKNPHECFVDRINHRTEWYNLICDYNKYNKTKLAENILLTSDCYVGMRNKDELDMCIKKDIFDLIIWVDASKRLPLENFDSINIESYYADFVIENNNSLKEFHKKILKIGNIIF